MVALVPVVKLVRWEDCSLEEREAVETILNTYGVERGMHFGDISITVKELMAWSYRNGRRRK